MNTNVDMATPRPWRISGQFSCGIFSDGETIADCNRTMVAENQANAKLIVRAVNAHDAMKEALEAAEIILSSVECGEEKPLATGMALDQARAALKLAKGGIIMNENEEEIKQLKKHYLDTEKRKREGKLKYATNVGDNQAAKLQRLRELGCNWQPNHQTIG